MSALQFDPVIQTRRLEAYERLWQAVLETERFVAPFIFPYDMMTPAEIKSQSVERIKQIVPIISNAAFDNRVKALTSDSNIEKHRPFASEQAWLLFFGYRAFALRLAMKVNTSAQEGHLRNWNENTDGTPDDAVHGQLGHLLAETELNALISSSPFGVPRRILDTLKVALIRDLRKELFARPG